MCADTSALMGRPKVCSGAPAAPTSAPTSAPVATMQPTPAPPTWPRPQSCADLCSYTPSSGSCSRHTSAPSCTSHYFRTGARVVPCTWTTCGKCFGDGDGLLECPDLDKRCSGSCLQLCGRVDLMSTGQTCVDLSNDQHQCERSFFSKAGRSMPCKWSGCTCYADGETLLECPALASLCPVPMVN